MSNQWFVSSQEKEGKSKVEIITMYLEGSRVSSTQDVANCLGCSANTARKWLHRMYQDGIVRVKLYYYGRGIAMYHWSIENE